MRTIPTTSQILDGARELVAKRGWCQGTMSRNKAGLAVCPNSAAAVTICPLTAIAIVAGSSERAEIALDALRISLGNPPLLTRWNDAPERTQAEVLTALQNAAAMARRAGQ